MLSKFLKQLAANLVDKLFLLIKFSWFISVSLIPVIIKCSIIFWLSPPNAAVKSGLYAV